MIVLEDALMHQRLQSEWIWEFPAGPNLGSPNEATPYCKGVPPLHVNRADAVGLAGAP